MTRVLTEEDSPVSRDTALSREGSISWAHGRIGGLLRAPPYTH